MTFGPLATTFLIDSNHHVKESDHQQNWQPKFGNNVMLIHFTNLFSMISKTSVNTKWKA